MDSGNHESHLVGPQAELRLLTGMGMASIPHMVGEDTNPESLVDVTSVPTAISRLSKDF